MWQQYIILSLCGDSILFWQYNSSLFYFARMWQQQIILTYIQQHIFESICKEHIILTVCGNSILFCQHIQYNSILFFIVCQQHIHWLCTVFFQVLLIILTEGGNNKLFWQHMSSVYYFHCIFQQHIFESTYQQHIFEKSLSWAH
jgi:hypothetical protein